VIRVLDLTKGLSIKTSYIFFKLFCITGRLDTIVPVMRQKTKLNMYCQILLGIFGTIFKIHNATNQPLELGYVNFDEIMASAKSLWNSNVYPLCR
jgi:hypothetical protein